MNRELEQKAREIMGHEDVFGALIEICRDRGDHSVASYGYEVYIPRVIDKWCLDNMEKLGIKRRDSIETAKWLEVLSPYFYNAAWELCRLGVLRPGVTSHHAQSTDDGNAGNGYSITPFGNQWLQESGPEYVPTEPGRFAALLEPFAKAFGPGFHERAQQAIRCYNAHAYLAACVMCGAAAESILLQLAITKNGYEEATLSLYRRANGRKKIEDLIIGQQKGGMKADFESCFALLKYWRDESAHGRKSEIGEAEAFTSLALLLRTAQFAYDNLDMLTTKSI
jgi:hypothetical protein